MFHHSSASGIYVSIVCNFVIFDTNRAFSTLKYIFVPYLLKEEKNWIGIVGSFTFYHRHSNRARRQGTACRKSNSSKDCNKFNKTTFYRAGCKRKTSLKYLILTFDRVSILALL